MSRGQLGTNHDNCDWEKYPIPNLGIEIQRDTEKKVSDTANISMYRTYAEPAMTIFVEQAMTATENVNESE